MTPEKEHIIIQQVLAGDTHAFASLVETYKDMAVVTAYNILLNQEDAEEIAQDAFIKAFGAIGTFKSEARFSTWLYRIVVNAALNKKKLKKPYAFEITETHEANLAVSVTESLSVQINSEHRKHIQAALQRLGMNERLCITLYYLNEFAVDEIQQVTGLSAANIKVLLYRGRKNLYTALEQSLKTELIHLMQQ